MKLEGIKANFLGDSITEGAGVPDVKYTYWNVLKERYGLAEARGYGIGGTRIARQTVPSQNPKYDLDFCSRVDGMDPDADLVVVFGGTNDFGHGDAPFGTIDDRTEFTFYGACHVLMRSLIEKYPSATIVFMTPLHRAVEKKPERPDVPHLSEYVRAIKEVAALYGIPVYDLYANSNIDPQIPVQKELFTKDGLHPNIAGAARIAERLGNFLFTL
ncbi:MAG: SGNH/GDSL hydrolase family protein [Clostridia bacterium]|nr:SGNH/GDSL hydrolase family protein [Clostridia bacterium]